MTNVWNLIKEWLALSAQKQLQAFLAAVLMASAYMVFHYERRLAEKDLEKNELIKAHNIENSKNQADKDSCYANHIRYIEASEKEIKELYFDVQKIKNK